MGMKHPADDDGHDHQAKRLRTEDSLVPEDQFIARHKVNHVSTLTY